MKKKGFTLVELLAVIAILAILVIIALPNVIKLYNDAKKNAFLTEVKSLYNTASSKYISESLKGNKLREINSNDSSKLDLNGNDLTYKIKLNSDGSVASIAVKKGNYCIVSSKDLSKITKSDVSEDCEGFNVLANWYDDCKDKNTLRCKILSDNETYDDSVKSKYVTSNSGINFKEISSDTNGKGLYYTTDSNATDENNDGLSNRIYYYRGDIKNNFVVMGDKCYRIIRTTENGNVKIMYHDKVNTDGTCNEEVKYVEGTELVGGQYEHQVRYNLNSTDLTYGGYMMGDTKLRSFKTKYSMPINVDAKNYKTNFSSDYKYENGVYSLTGNIITGTIKELCTKDNCKIKGYYMTVDNIMFKIISHEKMKVFAQLTTQDYQEGNTYYSDAFKYENGKFSLSGKMMKDPDEINNHCKNTTCYTLLESNVTAKLEVLYSIIGEKDGHKILDILSYGTDTQKEAYSNKNDSAIKKYVDAWYQKNIQDKNLSSKIADEIYCNDRSQLTFDKTAYINDYIKENKENTTIDEAKENGYESVEEYLKDAAIYSYFEMTLGIEYDEDYNYLGLEYASGYRLEGEKDLSLAKYIKEPSKPTYKCTNKNDRFTTTSLGNSKLTYPVAIMTADEVVYAGASPTKVNKKYMCANIGSFWTMTPTFSDFDMGAGVSVGIVRDKGELKSISPDNVKINLDDGLRRRAIPVLALKPDTEITKGNGTLTNPYVIK